MEEKTKQRLIGVLVLIGALFVILPFLFHNSRPSLNASTTTAENSATAASSTPTVSVSLPADNTTTANTAQSATQNNTAAASTSTTPISTTPTATTTTPTASATPATPVQTIAPAPTTTAKSDVASADPAPAQTQAQTQTQTQTSSTDGFVPDQAVSPTSGLTTGQHTGSLAPDPTLQATTQTQQASLAETSGVAHVAAAAPAPTTAPVHHAATKTVMKKHSVKLAEHHPIAEKNGWHVQLAAFSNRKNAEALMKKLRAHHFNAYTREIIHNHRRLTVVMVGPELNEHTAMMVEHRLRNEFRLSGVVRKSEA